jgi:hypothetical protein
MVTSHPINFVVIIESILHSKQQTSTQYFVLYVGERSTPSFQGFKEKGPSLRKHVSWTGKPGRET